MCRPMKGRRIDISGSGSYYRGEWYRKYLSFGFVKLSLNGNWLSLSCFIAGDVLRVERVALR